MATLGAPDPGAEPAAGGTPTIIQVVPAEVLASAGDTIAFEVRAFDAGGRLLGTRNATWAVADLAGGRVSANGVLSTDPRAANQAGTVVATVDDQGTDFGLWCDSSQ